MKTNVGGYDRIARLIVGPILAVVGAAALLDLVTLATGGLGLALAVLALVAGLWLVTTGTTRKSRVNRVLGVDTSRREPDAETRRESDVDAEPESMDSETGPGRAA